MKKIRLVTSAVFFTLFSSGCLNGVLQSSSDVSGSCSPDALSPKQALIFDGSGDYVDINVTGLTLPAVYTAEAHFKFTAGGVQQRIFGFDTGNVNGFQIYITASNFLSATTPNGLCTVSAAVNSLSALSVGVNHHVAVTQTGAAFNLYVDGIFQNSVAATSVSCGLNQGRIGMNFAASNLLTGVVDQIRVSNNIKYSGGAIIVPATRFCADANTILLMNFDSGNMSADFPATTSFSFFGNAAFVSSPFY